MAGANSNIVGSENFSRGIDTNSQGFRDDNSIRAAIEGGKNFKQIISGVDRELATMMKDMNSYTDQSKKSLDELLSKISAMGEGYKKALSNSLIFKRASEDIVTLKRATEEYNKALEDQTISDKDLLELYRKVSLSYQESADAISELTTATFDQNDSVTDLRDNLKVLYRELQEGSKSFKSDFKGIEKQIGDTSKAAGNLGQRISSFSNTVRSTITDIKTMLNVEKLAEGLGPSARMQIQTSYQQRYGISRAEFNSFKRDVYGSFNNSLYSAEDVLQTMQSASSMGFRNQNDISKYFDKILKGQQLLGMSAETQTALMQLSNKTGRDELTLGTNTFAKYFKEITNVSKEQLNQLININTNFASQMADLGVSSDVFNSVNAAVTGALTKASGDTALASLYNQVVGSYASSTELAAEMIGMTSGQWKSASNNGYSLLDALESGRGRAGNYYRAVLSGNYAYQDELSQGMDSATKNLIDQIARLQKEGKLTKEMISKFKGMDGDAILEELERVKEENMTESEKIAHQLENNYNRMIPWQAQEGLDHFLTGITNLLTYILAAVSISGGLFGNKGLFGSLADIKSLIGTAGSVHVAGSGSGILGGLVSLGTAAGATTTTGAGLLGAGMVALPLLGLGLAGYDAYKGYQAGGWGTAARYAFLGTGSKQDSTADKWKAAGGNMLKYGAIGAGIGTIFGPGVGTAIGGGIGIAVGGVLSLIGNSMDKQSKEQEETNKKLDTIANNTAKSATALTVREQGRNVVSVIPYSTKVKSSNGPSGRAMGGPVGVGGTSGLKYGVSSPYGYRDFDGWHYGVDFSGNINGAPLYSNVTGTVVDVGQDLDGANFVGVKGSDGYIHYYWHMIAPSTRSVGEHVNQGDLVGYVGSTGNSTGPHLHYQVTRSRYSDGYSAFLSNSVDPESFATNAIFSGSAASYDPNYSAVSDSSSSVSSNSLLASINKKTSAIKLASFGGTGGSDGIISSIVDLKNTIVSLSAKTDANEKLMRAITSTYNTQPRMG